MTIRLRKELFLSMLVLLPYFESNFTEKYLEIHFANSFIRSITVIMLLMALVLAPLYLLGKNPVYPEKKIRKVMIAIVIYSAMGVALSSHFVNSICEWTWLATPIVFALLVRKIYFSSKVHINLIIKYAIIWFTLYLILVVTYYIFVHNLFFDDTVRMHPRGGGAVIFGYTIALFFCLTIAYKKEFTSTAYYFILVVLSVGSLGTETRGSVWLIALLWVANFIFNKLDYKRVILFLILIPIVGAISNLDFNSLGTTTFTGIGRLLNLNSFRRVTSTVNVFGAFREFNIINKLFGVGLGNFFPYQQWLINVHNVDNNMFNYEGHSILVQPHNSFLYILMECGLIGLGAIISIFITSLKRIINNKNFRWIYKTLFVGTVFFLNCLDSVFFVQPGTAFVFWIMLLLVVDDDVLNANDSICIQDKK